MHRKRGLIRICTVGLTGCVENLETYGSELASHDWDGFGLEGQDFKLLYLSTTGHKFLSSHKGDLTTDEATAVIAKGYHILNSWNNNSSLAR